MRALEKRVKKNSQFGKGSQSFFLNNFPFIKVPFHFFFENLLSLIGAFSSFSFCMKYAVRTTLAFKEF